MKPETIQKILVSLKQEVDIKKTALIRYVEKSQRNDGLNERANEYRAAYNALVDFEIWMESLKEEQEDEE